MQKNAEKCKEMQKNAEKCIEVTQKYCLVMIEHWIKMKVNNECMRSIAPNLENNEKVAAAAAGSILDHDQH